MSILSLSSSDAPWKESPIVEAIFRRSSVDVELDLGGRNFGGGFNGQLMIDFFFFEVLFSFFFHM